jgi:hypothetical protein
VSEWNECLRGFLLFGGMCSLGWSAFLALRLGAWVDESVLGSGQQASSQLLTLGYCLSVYCSVTLFAIAAIFSGFVA